MKVTRAEFDEMARVGTVSHLEVVDDEAVDVAQEPAVVADPVEAVAPVEGFDVVTDAQPVQE